MNEYLTKSHYDVTRGKNISWNLKAIHIIALMKNDIYHRKYEPVYPIFHSKIYSLDWNSYFDFNLLDLFSYPTNIVVLLWVN